LFHNSHIFLRIGYRGVALQIRLFSPGGPNIAWNVTGDGIGEFIGMIAAQRPAIVRVK
jgi:hypothetical protein